MKKWRLLVDEPATGAWNMAVDEAMLVLHAARITPPTLRFYSFAPACLSLGRLQKKYVAPAGTEAVRRPTGGRAVWHQHEITYSVVVHLEHLPRSASSVVGAYHWVSSGLLHGLDALGVGGELAADPEPTGGAAALSGAGMTDSNCFGSATGNCDFTVNGKKLIGAAQCRKGEGVLQHGSLLLSINEEAWSRAAGGTMAGAVSLRQLGLSIPAPDIVEALALGFADKHGLELKAGSLTAEEKELATYLHNEKYLTPSWTQNGTFEPSGSTPLPLGRGGCL